VVDHLVDGVAGLDHQHDAARPLEQAGQLLDGVGADHLFMLVPLASLAMKSSTLETVRLKTATLKPWSFMLRTRFCPMTARPIRPISHNAEAVAKLTASGNVGVSTLEDLAKKLQGRKAIWIMVPQGKPVDDTIAKLEPLLNPGDILIDGGNSNYKDSMRRHDEIAAKAFQFVDVGTSGGVWGLKEGYSMMIGGDKEPVEYLRPIFETLAPAKDKGWGHVGPGGAGHFVKMIHNGIEYGMMQAYAEGFTIMEKKKELDLDLPQISQIWRYGSVVRSWLLDLTADALARIRRSMG
jgi:6-phosphogluconate dehydrogenase (decarboxylating)